MFVLSRNFFSHWMGMRGKKHAQLIRISQTLLMGGFGILPMQTTGGTFTGLQDQLTQIFGSLITIAKTIAPAVGILGFIGLGILYMGSSWPIISTWKQQNPQAVGNVMMGLFFVLFASLVASIIPNPGGFS